MVLFAVKVPLDAPTPEGAFELASLAGTTAAAPERKKRTRTKDLYVCEFEVLGPPRTVKQYEESGHTYVAQEDGRIQVDDGYMRGKIVTTPTALLTTTLEFDIYVTAKQADAIDKFGFGVPSKYVVDLTGELADAYHNEPVPPFEKQLFYEFCTDGSRRVPSSWTIPRSEVLWPGYEVDGTFYSSGGLLVLCSERRYAVGKVWLTSDGALLTTEPRFDLSAMTEPQRAAAEAWRAAAEKRRAAKE